MTPLEKPPLPMENRPPIRFQPQGRSMHPFIRPGDRVTIRLLAEEAGRRYRPGDCVVFRDRWERWLIHRVIGRGRGPNIILTKGDALPRPDSPVEMERLAGMVCSLERPGSGRIYLLDRPGARFLGRVIAILSRCETVVLSLGGRAPAAGRNGILIRLIKTPRWLLTRLFFP